MAELAIPVITDTAKAPSCALPRSRARRWIARGVLAILDQGLISGSNFVLGILLARWLGHDQYGAYALAFTIFVLLSLVYQALLLEPMSVFGPSVFRERLQAYSTTLLWLHMAISFATCVVMGFAGWMMLHWRGSSLLPSALMGAAIAAPCVLFFWLVRRIYYLRIQPGQAAIGAVLYCATVFAALAFLQYRHIVSPMTAFLAMAIGAVASSTFLFLRTRRHRDSESTATPLSSVAREHWTYGRWALASSIFMWVPWNVFYTLVAGFAGMSQAGGLRALLNFALPMAQTYGAMSLLFLPHAAITLDGKSNGGISKVCWRITLLFIGFGAAYWTSVTVLRKPLLHLLYAGQYSEVAGYIPIIGIASILWGAAQGPAISLRANKTPALVFHIYFGAAVVALAVGIPLTRVFGMTGAAYAMLMASGSAWLIGIICVRRCSGISVVPHRATS